MARYITRPVAVGMLPRGRKWTVKDLGDTMQGYVKLLERELGVSRADAPHTRFVQLHEMSHVQWSKYSPGKLAKAAGLPKGAPSTHVYINAAEDARVNALLRRSIPDACEGFELPPDARLRNDLSGYMSSWRTPEAVRASIRGALEGMGLGDACKAIDAECERLERAGKLTGRDMTVPLAKFVARLSERPHERPDRDGDKEREGEGDEGDGSASSGGGSESKDGPSESKPGGDKTKDESKDGEDESSGASKDGDGSKDGSGKGDSPKLKTPSDGWRSPSDAASVAKAAKEDAKLEGGDDPWIDSEPFIRTGKDEATDPCARRTDEPVWSIPTVETPALTLTVQRPGTHDRTASDSGVILRDVARIATDGQVFGRSRQRPGSIKRGTFLIDVSGSMALSPSDVDEIINAVPTAQVAIYSGRPGGASIIAVVAKDGKRFDFEKYRHESYTFFRGGNTCDGPALLWLARQNGPKYWYCDGLVTNRNDAGNPLLREECEAIVAAARIVHIKPMMGGCAHGHQIVNELKRLRAIR